MSRQKTFWIYLLLVLFSSAPLLLVFLSIGIANMQGCTLDEGGSHLCKLFGGDIGETLYMGFVMGWFSLITLPTGLLAIAGFTIYTIVKRKTSIVQ